MALEQVSEDIWVVPGEVKLMPGAFLPARATVIRLEDGLWVHSPVRLQEEDAAQIDTLGAVKTLVAPNNLHHLFIKRWQERWPEAKMVGARGLKKKRADLEFDGTLDEDVQWPAIESLFVGGAPAWGETVFFHSSSQTLVCTDLLFNLGAHNTRGWLTPWVLRMAGAWHKPMQSRLVRTVVKDRPRAGAAVKRILDWPFERIIMAHGDVVEADARQTLERACHWMLKAAA
ncbi:MAG: hypothetical protein AAFQ82_07890 [Myxococcota bacterium]